MKKSFLSMLCICFILAVHVNVKAASPGPVYHKYAQEEWSKAKNGIWNGVKDKKNYWYKLDKEAKLWWSTNGKKWIAVDDGMWTDKDGYWLKVSDARLMWSADKGTTWSEVPEWKWEGPKGEWYKFDKDWTVWVTGNGIS
jgi:hypothetical protein